MTFQGDSRSSVMALLDVYKWFPVRRSKCVPILRYLQACTPTVTGKHSLQATVKKQTVKEQGTRTRFSNKTQQWVRA